MFFVEVVVYGLDYLVRGSVDGACVWVPHGVEGGKVRHDRLEARRGFEVFVVPFWALFVCCIFVVFESFVEFKAAVFYNGPNSLVAYVGNVL